jgi:hypothetical protein
VIDVQADQGALDDGQLTVMLQPTRAVREPGMQPVPTGSDRRAIAGGRGVGNTPSVSSNNASARADRDS